MPERYRRGRLKEAWDAPSFGERLEVLLAHRGVVIEHILSSNVPDQGLYEQDHDEWVVLVNGSATLVVEDETVELAAGEWLFLPAFCRHRVMRTEAGTTWLAVHLSREPGR